MARTITTHDFGALIIEALGLDPIDARIARIVIDIKANDLVNIYITKRGDSRLLDLPWKELIDQGNVIVKEVTDA